MYETPTEIKLTYIVAIIILASLVIFILLISRLFRKKQSNYVLQQQLLENKIELEILQSKLDKQAAISEERKRISYDMHDELGSGLSSIKLLSNLLKSKYSDIESSNKLNLINSHASSLTNSMRELVWYLNPDNDTFQDFVLYVIKYGKAYFDQLEISFLVDHPSSILDNSSLEGLKRRNLFLCVKEIFNNIIKHSKADQVILSYNISNFFFELNIQDNGIGLSNNIEPNTGLKSLNERIESCDGEIKFENLDKGLKIAIKVRIL